MAVCNVNGVTRSDELTENFLPDSAISLRSTR